MALLSSCWTSAVAALCVLLVCASTASAAASAGLYGVLSPVQLASVDTTTGTPTPLGVAHPTEAQAQQLSTIDAASGTLYILGWNATSRLPNLVGFDLTNGAMTSSVDLGIAELGFVGLSQSVSFDPKTGNCVIMGVRSASNSSVHEILVVNPKTGALVKNVTSIIGINVLGGVSAFDTSNTILYVQLGIDNGIDVVAVEIMTGHVYKIAMQYGTGKDISNMGFDKQANALYGFAVHAINATAFHRTVVKLNPVTKTFEEMGNVDGFGIMSGSVGSVDSDSHTMSGYFQKQGASAKDPFYLVTVDVESGKVLQSPVAGTLGKLPWSLQYLM